MAPNNDRRMISSHPSLVGVTVAMDSFCPSLLCYHCSDIVVTTGKIPVTTVIYDPFLQRCGVVVFGW
jgi:hypothetical protein